MEINLDKLGITPGEWVPGKDGQSIITTDKELCAKMIREKYGRGTFKFYGGEVVCESIHEKDKALVCSAKELLKDLILSVIESEESMRQIQKEYQDFAVLLKKDAEKIIARRIKLIEKALPGFTWEEIKKLVVKE